MNSPRSDHHQRVWHWLHCALWYEYELNWSGSIYRNALEDMITFLSQTNNGQLCLENNRNSCVIVNSAGCSRTKTYNNESQCLMQNVFICKCMCMYVAAYEINTCMFDVRLYVETSLHVCMFVIDLFPCRRSTNRNAESEETQKTVNSDFTLILFVLFVFNIIWLYSFHMSLYLVFRSI